MGFVINFSHAFAEPSSLSWRYRGRASLLNYRIVAISTVFCDGRHSDKIREAGTDSKRGGRESVG